MCQKDEGKKGQGRADGHKDKKMVKKYIKFFTKYNFLSIHYNIPQWVVTCLPHRQLCKRSYSTLYCVLSLCTLLIIT